MRLDQRTRRIVGLVLPLIALLAMSPVSLHADEGGTCSHWLCQCNDLIFSDAYHQDICDPGAALPAYCREHIFHYCDIYGEPELMAQNMSRLTSDATT
jgi:hypothetical protein